MEAILNGRIAAEIADHLKTRGFDTVEPSDVFDTVTFGSVPEGTIGEVYDARLTEAIIEQLDARGIAVR